MASYRTDPPGASPRGEDDFPRDDAATPVYLFGRMHAAFCRGDAREATRLRNAIARRWGYWIRPPATWNAGGGH